MSELSSGFNSPAASNFIQWGTNGLAFIATNSCCGTATTQVVLIQSPSLLLTTSKTPVPAPVSHDSIPATASHGGGNFLLSVRGSGFVPGSVVMWNGKRFSASYVNGNAMKVYVPRAAIASSGRAAIMVKNPAPGGGKSNPLTFTIK